MNKKVVAMLALLAMVLSYTSLYAQSGITVRHSTDGKCYACFLDKTSGRIVLYSIGLEDDILPE